MIMLSGMASSLSTLINLQICLSVIVVTSFQRNGDSVRSPLIARFAECFNDEGIIQEKIPCLSWQGLFVKRVFIQKEVEAPCVTIATIIRIRRRKSSGR